MDKLQKSANRPRILNPKTGNMIYAGVGSGKKLLEEQNNIHIHLTQIVPSSFTSFPTFSSVSSENIMKYDSIVIEQLLHCS